MKNLFIADTYHTIKETEDCLVTEEMIDKLDDMLTEYGVQHYFSLPTAADEDGYAKDGDVLNVFYDASEDDLTWHLVYALWLKTVRGYKNDDKIRRSFAKKLKAE